MGLKQISLIFLPIWASLAACDGNALEPLEVKRSIALLQFVAFIIQS